MKQEFYYYDGKEQIGPLSIDQLKSVGLQSDTWVWKIGTELEWIPAKEVKELQFLFSTNDKNAKTETDWILAKEVKELKNSLSDWKNEFKKSKDLLLKDWENELKKSKDLQLKDWENELKKSKYLQLKDWENELKKSKVLLLNDWENELKKSKNLQLKDWENELKKSKNFLQNDWENNFEKSKNFLQNDWRNEFKELQSSMTAGDSIEQNTKKNWFGIFGFIFALSTIFFGTIPLWGLILWSLGLILSFIGLFSKPRIIAFLGMVISFIVWIIMNISGIDLFQEAIEVINYYY